MFSTIDTEGVLFFNRLTISNDAWHTIAYFCAHYLIFVIFVTAIVTIVAMHQYRSSSIGSHVLAQAFLSTVLAMAVGLFFASSVARLRPYEVISGVEVLGRLPGNSSFPSAHTFISFAFASVFLFYPHYRKLGIVLMVMAALVGIGRVMAGFHYPTDIIGGILVGFISSITMVYSAKPLFMWLGRWKGDRVS